MKKAVSIFVMAIFLLVSCTKPENQGGGDVPPPVYPRYEIGDYFKNDTLEGVVFFTIAGGSSGMMVSLDETCAQWCYPTHINMETGATNARDGWNNTNLVMENYNLHSFPAIEWSYEKNTWHLVHYEHRQIIDKQWYVPSSNEMRYLMQNQEAVNATLEARGYPTLEGKTYWSSTETGTRGAATVRWQNGEVVIGEELKDQMFYVRAMRNF